MFYHSSILSRSITLTAILMLSACGGSVVGTQASPVAASPLPAVTSAGTEFYLTLPDHLCTSEPASCNNLPVANKLIIAAHDATTGEISFNHVITPFTLEAGAQTVITLDPGVVLTANETIESKAIHVTALSPVSVHVVSENATSADGYLALPVPGLGTEYYVMSYASGRYTGSEFAVVATQSNTSVTILPAAAGASKGAGEAFTVVLNAGETYQLSNPANGDMTGSHVTADKPVAVFSGHRCADVPSGVGYCDYLVEQLPGVDVWGNTFHTLPFSGRARYTVRVIAAHNGTTFNTLPAGLVGTLDAGQFVDVELTEPGEFVSNQPVLLAQFMRGYADDLAAKGDPSMVLVTPEEMGMTNTTFGVHGLAGTSGALMNIVTETAGLASLTLDHVVVNAALFTPLGAGSLYSAATLPVAPGAHTLEGSVPYTALVYDFGIKWNAVSYAYPLASKLSVAAYASQPAPIAGGCEGDDEDEAHENAESDSHLNHAHRHHHRRTGNEHSECHD